MIVKALLYWDSASFALPYFPLASMYLFTQLTWLYSAWSPSPASIWASQLCNPSFVCPSMNILFLYSSSFSLRSASPSHLIFSFGDWVKDYFPCGSSEMVAHPCPIPFVLLMYHGVILVWLVRHLEVVRVIEITLELFSILTRTLFW